MFFHIDIWNDDIGGGLRLPHPFNIVIGEGATLGERCMVMHNVTIQRGEGTVIGDDSVLGTGSVILAGAHVGERALVGALTLIKGDIPCRGVASGPVAGVIGRRRKRVPIEEAAS